MLVINHYIVFLQQFEKQLQFTSGEKNKIQHALEAVKRQWQEHQTTCGGSHKVPIILMWKRENSWLYISFTKASTQLMFETATLREVTDQCMELF